jgi:hypothetical protein
MLGMVHHEFGNDEVQFRISIPWEAQGSDDFDSVMDSLYYLERNFGVDPMSCNDSYFEGE